MNPPHAIHTGARLGTIEEGKLADYVVLDEDPFTMPKERLGEMTIRLTVVAGAIAYDSRAQ